MRGHFPGCTTREEARAVLAARRRRAATCKNCGHPVADHVIVENGEPWWKATRPSGKCTRHDDGTDRPYVQQQGPACPCPGFVPVEPLA